MILIMLLTKYEWHHKIILVFIPTQQKQGKYMVFQEKHLFYFPLLSKIKVNFTYTNFT